MWASRWAPSQSQVSTKDKNNDDSKTTRPPRRSTILGPATPLNLDDFDLTRGLEASRWATSTPISSTADQLGFGPIPRRGGRRGRRGHVRANSIQLTVNTSPLASGPTLCYDDSSDVVMGENTPVASPVEYVLYRFLVRGTSLTERCIAVPISLSQLSLKRTPMVMSL